MLKKRLYWIFVSLLIFIFIGSLSATLHPQIRNQLKQFVKGEGERKVLSVLTGDVLRNGNLYKITKISEKEKIYIEIFEEKGDSFRFVDKKELSYSHDGFFYFKGHSTNLALGDVNKDGILEILAPSYDINLTPHLEVYKFNEKRKKLELVSEDEI